MHLAYLAACGSAGIDKCFGRILGYVVPREQRLCRFRYSFGNLVLVVKREARDNGFIRW